MQVRNIQSVQEIISLLKILIAFTRETYDHVHTYTTMRHYLFNVCHTLFIKFFLISAAHCTQNIITPALQGYMKMRHEFVGVCNKADNIIVEQIRLN